MQKETNQEVIAESQHILDLFGKDALSKEEKDWLAKESVDTFGAHVNPALLKYKLAGYGDHVPIEWANTPTGFIDTVGNEYLDCLGGYGIYNCGHGHPKIVEAVINQLKKQPMATFKLMDPLKGMLAKMLATITPGDLKYSFLCNSGTEAVEGALKLAKAYTRRRIVVAATKGFHGKSLGSLSATAKKVFREPFYPLLPGFRHIPYGDADALRMIFEVQDFIGDSVGAVLLEPIQGEGGVVLPPEGYIAQVRKVCDEYDAVLIADEIQTGMGRTGSMFAMEQEGVVPDILTLAKSLGGGILPIGAFVASEKIWKPLSENPVLHTSTFSGNPVGCAAAIATINVLLEENLPNQAKEKGEYVIPKLDALMKKYPEMCVEARGRGLLIAMEFVNNEAGMAMVNGLFKRKIVVGGTLMSAEVIRIEPPLVITYEELDKVLEAVEQILEENAPAFRKK